MALPMLPAPANSSVPSIRRLIGARTPRVARLVSWRRRQVQQGGPPGTWRKTGVWEARAGRLCGRLFPVRRQPLIDQRHGGINNGVAQALLAGNELHELIGALDVGGTVVERARRRG